MIILGIDPGQSGACAWLDGNALVRVEDMPCFEVMKNGKPRKELNVHGLAALLSEHRADVCFYEQVGGMDGDSPSSAFTFGRIAGAAEAVVKLSGARFEFVAPHVWKKAMGLIGTAKDQSRAKATNRWPGFAKQFSRKMDDGRAEAALLAEYGRQKLHQEGVFS
jgi:crossover junction endodeoxyribonuclease RuvC